MPYPEHGQTPEILRERKRALIEHGVNDALDDLYQRFDIPADPLERLPYHNRKHSEGVITRTVTILESLRTSMPQINGEKIELARFAAAHHDSIQRWVATHGTFAGRTTLMRKRFVGENEIASAQHATKAMTDINAREGDLFSREDLETVHDAIVGTTTVFDPNLRTIRRPHLNPESSPTTRALVLADLGTIGMESAESVLQSEDALFREDNLDFITLAQGDHPDSSTQDFIRDRILAWTESRPTFITGRKKIIPVEFEGLPHDAIVSLNELFSNFDETLRESEAQIVRRKKMPFEELVREVGYPE